MSWTATSVPWWYVATLAGVFTIVGVLASLSVSWLIARRKNKLDDFRRFESDIIEAYVRLDEIADVLHYNAGGDPEAEKRTYWEVYREVIRIVTRLSLVAPPKVYELAREYQAAVSDMMPGAELLKQRPLMSMPELVEALDELRRVIRRELRVGPAIRLRRGQRIRDKYLVARLTLDAWRFDRGARSERNRT